MGVETPLVQKDSEGTSDEVPLDLKQSTLKDPRGQAMTWGSSPSL